MKSNKVYSFNPLKSSFPSLTFEKGNRPFNDNFFYTKKRLTQSPSIYLDFKLKDEEKFPEYYTFSKMITSKNLPPIFNTGWTIPNKSAPKANIKCAIIKTNVNIDSNIFKNLSINKGHNMRNNPVVKHKFGIVYEPKAKIEPIEEYIIKESFVENYSSRHNFNTLS